ncbi:unnamed protein product [Brachionus calyciflorus]|uniref:Voltage-gated hydrogen channel 1 n=1 Tax=Brachionus calyciflorus TaxID=104777 RepID=A0A813UYP7_9BILA|nr:unnamed protein product [Brachionus calyciflorus]
MSFGTLEWIEETYDNFNPENDVYELPQHLSSQKNNCQYGYDREITCFQKLKKKINSNKFQIVIILFVFINFGLNILELIFSYLEIFVSENFESKDENFKKSILIVLKNLNNFTKIASIIIQILFVFEIFFKFVLMFGNFKKFFEKCDIFIVLTAFGLNCLLIKSKYHIHTISGLVLLLRLWKLYKIAQSYLIKLEIKHEEKVKSLEDKIKLLQDENLVLNIKASYC